MTLHSIMRNLTWVDFAVLGWVGFCIGLGVAIAVEIRELDRYGMTIDQTADALTEVATALFLLDDVPFLGAAVRDVAAEIAATATRLRESASDTRSSAANLSILLAIAVAVIPTAPLIAFYLPNRLKFGPERSPRPAPTRGGNLDAFLGTDKEPHH